jgi:hypothetical protein
MALLKAVKRVALDRDSTLSATLAKGLLEGIEARRRGRKRCYLDHRKDVYRRLS